MSTLRALKGVQSTRRLPLPAASAEKARNHGRLWKLRPRTWLSRPCRCKTHEVQEVTPEEKQRAAVLQQQATAEEQTVAAQVSRIQALMQKEEQDLARASPMPPRCEPRAWPRTTRNFWIRQSNWSVSHWNIT